MNRRITEFPENERIVFTKEVLDALNELVNEDEKPTKVKSWQVVDSSNNGCTEEQNKKVIEHFEELMNWSNVTCEDEMFLEDSCSENSGLTKEVLDFFELYATKYVRNDNSKRMWLELSIDVDVDGTMELNPIYVPKFWSDESRQTGTTTRLADKLIQDLFEYGFIRVEDVPNHFQANRRLLDTIINRLSTEHRHLKFESTCSPNTCTIKLIK